MRCPKCNVVVRRPLEVCPQCGYSVAEPEKQSEQPTSPAQKPARSRTSQVVNLLVVMLLLILSVGFFGLLSYNGYFWFDNWRINRIYESGELRAPNIEELTMADGRVGRAITFFGHDGDEIFVPELDKSYMFVGGLTRIEIPDSQWFSNENPETLESAVVRMYPVIYTEGNNIVRLPELRMDVPTPISPLTMINPTTPITNVITSNYTLELSVVPRSTVLINGEDVSSFVSFDGLLTAPIRVFPEGDNNISIFVSTPNHKQTRKDIVLVRPRQSINLEPSERLPKSTNSRTFTVSGSSEPGAQIWVDTKYVDGSLKVDNNGDFAFQARMDRIGENIVSYHATMPGRQDQPQQISVHYVPTLNEYSYSAWAMNYAEMPNMTVPWAGQAFKCVGPVIELLTDDPDNPQFTMDVAPANAEEPQYIVLDVDLLNKAKMPEVGIEYTVWADLNETQFYENRRCPKLVARYVFANDPPA